MKNKKRLEPASDDELPKNENVNVRGKKPSKEIWAADCETDPFLAGRIPRPFIWGCYNGSEYHEFDTVDQLLDFLATRDCIAYAHNGGRFDWHYVLDHLEGFTPIMVISGRLAKFKIGRCEFRDSYNIMPMPLRAGGKKFEIDDYSIFESGKRELPGNRVVIQERLRTDCLYLFAMLETFFTEFGIHLTISSASMHAWSRIAGVEKPTTNAEFYQRVSPYYFGGRVECFTPGEVKRNFKIIDINSAYLWAMLSEHPYGEIPHESKYLPSSRGHIERSFVTLECKSTGAFPYRNDSGGLDFPADGHRRIFCVTGWEYLAALETNTLVDPTVYTVLQLPGSINFRSYCDHFYKMKTDAKANKDAARYEFAKRFLCSLYGKFGSNPKKYSEYTVVQPRFIDIACESDGYQFCAELGNWALLSRPLADAKKRYFNVAVAASVTGLVRAYDWRAIRQCEGVQYIDTDCLHCVGSGQLALSETELGAWKLEAECDYGAYGGKKLYACRTTDGNWKTASKGVKLTADQICRVAQGEVIDFTPDVPQYSIKQGIHFVSRKIRKTG